MSNIHLKKKNQTFLVHPSKRALTALIMVDAFAEIKVKIGIGHGVPKVLVQSFFQ